MVVCGGEECEESNERIRIKPINQSINQSINQPINAPQGAGSDRWWTQQALCCFAGARCAGAAAFEEVPYARAGAE
jgi:hypothetical protein